MDIFKHSSPADDSIFFSGCIERSIFCKAANMYCKKHIQIQINLNLIEYAYAVWNSYLMFF